MKLTILILLVISLSLSLKHQSSAASFCWLNSYGRGVGKIPSSCPPNTDRIGLLCYDKCSSDKSRFGFDCHSNCPSGFTNNGLFCRLNQYGRGAGFPWKFGDSLNDKGMYKRCESQNGRGNCQKWGAIVYPKCKSGYSPFGCCICRPSVPNCGSLGLNPGIDLSCAKKVDIGHIRAGVCNDGQQNDAGLCYPVCKHGYKGVGPVCWMTTPSGWVNCGMAAAKTSATCASTIVGQVTSVGALALNVATFGSSGAATTAANQAKIIKQFKELYAKFKDLKQYASLMAKGASIGMQTAALATADPDKVTAADAIRLAATIASLTDPTGVASTVAAFSYPKCSDIGF